MSDDAACPNCGETEFWTVLATTQVGVQLPGESEAATDRQTKHELHICADCGVCYDPVIAADE